MPEKNKFSTNNKNKEKNRIEAVNFIVPCSVTLILYFFIKRSLQPISTNQTFNSIHDVTQTGRVDPLWNCSKDNLVEEPSLPAVYIRLNARCLVFLLLLFQIESMAGNLIHDSLKLFLLEGNYSKLFYSIRQIRFYSSSTQWGIPTRID